MFNLEKSVGAKKMCQQLIGMA